MPKSKALIDAEGEVRELTAAEIERFRAVEDVLPDTLVAKLKVRDRHKTSGKERVSILLSPEVVQPFRATGEGWQTRVDAALRDWLKSHTPADF